MKTIRFFLPLAIAVLCFSCQQPGAEFTPYIQVSYFYLNPVFEGDKIVSAEDTLSFTTDQGGSYVLDSIDVDDHVTFMVGFGSYANDLIATRVTFDTTQLDMQAKLSEAIQAILLPSSDIRNIQLLINPGFNYLSFPVNYAPQKSGVFHFGLKVESDSQFSPAAVNFIQPVR